MSLGKVGGAVTWQGWVRPIGAAHHISTTRPILCSGCDNCNEWFHGDCIRITEKMAKAIREWYCRECQGEGGGMDKVGRGCIDGGGAIMGCRVMGSSDTCLWAE